jgi:hypothetical protein
MSHLLGCQGVGVWRLGQTGRQYNDISNVRQEKGWFLRFAQITAAVWQRHVSRCARVQRGRSIVLRADQLDRIDLIPAGRAGRLIDL